MQASTSTSKAAPAAADVGAEEEAAEGASPVSKLVVTKIELNLKKNC